MKKTKTFSSNESNLVLDFTGINGVTFNTGSNCTFKTGSDCVIVRRDIFEVIQPKEGVQIKLNPYRIKGYIVIEEVKAKEMSIEEIQEALGYKIKIVE